MSEEQFPFLPITRDEMTERGWEEVDIIIVTGDAYVDHPAFAAAILGRLLESRGYRVGVIARPDSSHADSMAQLGPPRLFFAVAPGAVDSMVNNFTAQRRRRRTDAYAPGGKGGGRPDRALIGYCNLIRTAFGKSVAILAGGIEASLRRFAHYDFMDDAVRRPILLDAPADALVYGMGERAIVEMAAAMRDCAAGERNGQAPGAALSAIARRTAGAVWRSAASEPPPRGMCRLPDAEAVRNDVNAHVEAFNAERLNRHRGIYQECAGHRVVANPPSRPLSQRALDAVYALPFARRAHPSYGERIPALEQVQFSVTSHRGCLGGCAFCGIATHQGRQVQSRSRESILEEVRRITEHPDFKGTIRDIGGATANMWGATCDHARGCTRASCLAPQVCEHLKHNQSEYVKLLEAAAKINGVKHLFVSSGVRMDLALEFEPLIEALARYHTSGYARVAPEHVVPEILELMLKPAGNVFERYVEKFAEASRAAGKEQYVLPYFIAAHPGCRIEDMVRVAELLHRYGLRVEQCQIFTPIPGTASAVMFATGINPFTGKTVFVERASRRREMQKALVLFHLPRNRKLVEEALRICGRRELASKLLPTKKRRPARHARTARHG